MLTCLQEFQQLMGRYRGYQLPRQDAEHPKCKSTGGFHQPEWSPCMYVLCEAWPRGAYLSPVKILQGQQFVFLTDSMLDFCPLALHLTVAQVWQTGRMSELGSSPTQYGALLLAGLFDLHFPPSLLVPILR